MDVIGPSSLVEYLTDPTWKQSFALVKPALSGAVVSVVTFWASSVSFLGLRDHRLEPLLHMCGRQRNELRWVFHFHQVLGEVKGSVRIGVGELNDLEVVVCSALGGSRICLLEEVGCML